MTEDQLEQDALGWLADVDYQHRYGPELAPDGSTPERLALAASAFSRRPRHDERSIRPPADRSRQRSWRRLEGHSAEDSARFEVAPADKRSIPEGTLEP